MGSHHAFHCSNCNYANPQCCGGTEAGMMVTLSTVHCSTCAELYDVPVAEHGYTFTSVPIRCPKSKRHAVVRWKDPGPCPKCGTVLTNEGVSAIWD